MAARWCTNRRCDTVGGSSVVLSKTYRANPLAAGGGRPPKPYLTAHDMMPKSNIQRELFPKGYSLPSPSLRRISLYSLSRITILSMKEISPLSRTSQCRIMKIKRRQQADTSQTHPIQCPTLYDPRCSISYKFTLASEPDGTFVTDRISSRICCVEFENYVSCVNSVRWCTEENTLNSAYTTAQARAPIESIAH